MNGIQVPNDVYLHVSGIDLIRDASGAYLVLEDNCRTPSDVSYVLKNREVMKQAFSSLFEDYLVRPVDSYASDLLAALRRAAVRSKKSARPRLRRAPSKPLPKHRRSRRSRCSWHRMLRARSPFRPSPSTATCIVRDPPGAFAANR